MDWPKSSNLARNLKVRTLLRSLNWKSLQFVERKLGKMKLSIIVEIDFPSMSSMTDGQKEHLEERIRYFADCYGMLDTGLEREISPSEVVIHCVEISPESTSTEEIQ